MMINQSQIKWIALILMLADHIGVLIEAEPLRIVGRLIFPLFAWIFAKNWQRSGEKKALITRLLLFGIISQIPYILLFSTLQLNIMFGFAATAITFKYIRKFNYKITILAISLVAAQILNISYGWYAIACPLMMLEFENSRVWWTGWIMTNIIYTITSGVWIQIFAVITPIILSYHNPKHDYKPGAIEKRFFYYFYPIHIAGLAALKTTI